MSAPTAVTAAVAIGYQVATNNGESSVQCEAYSVAASPAEINPASAPANAGRAGAPCRNPTSAPARSGKDNSGIEVMQTRELLPTKRVIIGSRCGIIISPAIPAAMIPAG